MISLDSKAQVSVEYLLTVIVGVVLAVAAAILALNLSAVAFAAQTKILSYRQSTIASLMS